MLPFSLGSINYHRVIEKQQKKKKRFIIFLRKALSAHFNPAFSMYACITREHTYRP